MLRGRQRRRALSAPPLSAEIFVVDHPAALQWFRVLVGAGLVAWGYFVAIGQAPGTGSRHRADPRPARGVAIGLLGLVVVVSGVTVALGPIGR